MIKDSQKEVSCLEVDYFLDDYLEDSLCQDKTEKFQKHISSCEYCAGVVTDTRNLISMARKLADVPMPKDVSIRLRERLRKEIGV